MDVDRETVHFLKIVVLGESGVGKSAVLNRYVNDLFTINLKSTIGADMLTKDVFLDNQPNKTIKLQIWDTAGQERFRSLGKAFYRGTNACIIMYDITNINSFNKIMYWKNEFILNSDIHNNNDNNKFPFLLIGNKIDLIDERVIKAHDARIFCDENGGMLHYETSAKSGENIQNALNELISYAVDYNDNVPYYAKSIDINNINITNNNDNNNNNNNNINTNDNNENSTCACQII